MANIDWEFFSGVHHFYSPVPSLKQIRNYDKVVESYKEVLDIDLNEEQQQKNLMNFEKYYQEIPFLDNKQKELRFYFKNMYFSYTDAIILYSFIRMLKPKNIIEMGSGFSSAVMLDTNQTFFNSEINFTFIEPYPDRLYGLLTEMDKKKYQIFDDSILNIDISIFERLEAGDILFIDSSHVSKFASDVNDIIFRILPHLKSGVYIHFHDIFYPFEQPKGWLDEGRYWNETYLLKAFLMNNDKYKIEFFNDFMWKFYSKSFETVLPLGAKNHGGSLWISKQ